MGQLLLALRGNITNENDYKEYPINFIYNYEDIQGNEFYEHNNNNSYFSGDDSNEPKNGLVEQQNALENFYKTESRKNNQHLEDEIFENVELKPSLEDIKIIIENSESILKTRLELNALKVGIKEASQKGGLTKELETQYENSLLAYGNVLIKEIQNFFPNLSHAEAADLVSKCGAFRKKK